MITFLANMMTIEEEEEEDDDDDDDEEEAESTLIHHLYSHFPLTLKHIVFAKVKAIEEIRQIQVVIMICFCSIQSIHIFLITLYSTLVTQL